MAIGGHAEATAEQAIAIGSDTGAGTATTNKKLLHLEKCYCSW